MRVTIGPTVGWDSAGWEAVRAALIEAIVGQKFPVYTRVKVEMRVAGPPSPLLRQ